MTKLYGPRNPHELQPYYSEHVAAMTTEGLCGKSEIAAELAFRDQRLAEAVSLLTKCKTCNKPATRKYPTGEMGYYVPGCDAHPQGPEHCEFTDALAFDLQQAQLVRALASGTGEG